MQILFWSLLFVLGACFGSFLCCQARRLRIKATSKKPLSSRSVCLHCHHQLRWYDNLPIFSWLALKGKCRKCHHPIGFPELFSEIGTALAFLALGTIINPFTATPLEWLLFCAVIVFSSVLIFLAIYDGVYGELPMPALILAIICAVVVLILKEISILITHPFTISLAVRPLLSFAILGGLYLLLYLVSKGKWVGDGDWLLGTAIGIAVFEPWLALVVLFLSNLLACLTMYPFIRTKKHPRIHFGPFLVIAFILVYTFSGPILALVAP